MSATATQAPNTTTNPPAPAPTTTNAPPATTNAQQATTNAAVTTIGSKSQEAATTNQVFTTLSNGNIVTITGPAPTASGTSSNAANPIDFKSTGFIIAYIVAGVVFILLVIFVLYRSRSKSKESLLDLQAASGTAPPAPQNKIPVLTDLPFLTETIPDRHPNPSSNVYVQENAPGWSGPKARTPSPQPQYAQYPIPPSGQLMPNHSPETRNRTSPEMKSGSYKGSPEPNAARPLPNPPGDQYHGEPYDIHYYQNASQYYDQNQHAQYYDQNQHAQYYDQNHQQYYQQYPPQNANYQQYGYNPEQKQ
ncbi:hypothetical protein HDV01_005714 [Terramyces sp. JEL0728]|nr:hypothetical protein HDV01_005714 [Terramyces sp. JEL0728]